MKNEKTEVKNVLKRSGFRPFKFQCISLLWALYLALYCTTFLTKDMFLKIKIDVRRSDRRDLEIMSRNSFLAAKSSAKQRFTFSLWAGPRPTRFFTSPTRTFVIIICDHLHEEIYCTLVPLSFLLLLFFTHFSNHLPPLDSRPDQTRRDSRPDDFNYLNDRPCDISSNGTMYTLISSYNILRNKLSYYIITIQYLI